jgi:hypothetical protein
MIEPREFWVANLAAFEKAVFEKPPGAILIVPEMERCPLLPLMVNVAVPEASIDDPTSPPGPD